MVSRWGGKQWADEEDDDFPLPDKAHAAPTPTRFCSQPDANGIMTVYEYIQKDGLSYKVEKKVRTRDVYKKVNRAVIARQGLSKFGKELHVDQTAFPGGAQTAVDAETDIDINPALKHKSIGDDEKFWEESIGISEQLLASSVKKKWDANAIRMGKVDEENLAASNAPAAAQNAAADQQAAQQMMQDAEKKGAYVPPSLRNKARTEADRAKEETTLRVTNLSEDVRDGDLQVLFLPFGRLQRVYLARYRDGEKEGQSKGFAFVTFQDRKDAEAAMKKLHGHGYDNLILQVNWAQPRV
eukprot:GEMP01018382.1.p1 GENE.GEMP01018382.1~~GEMP01018382.1.p1  ORF type:complete len:297 (+),score=88.50 GEMP01018382.1:187-1077(+)